MNIWLSKTDTDTLIFHVWKSLAFPYRMLLSLSLIITGFLLQTFYLTTSPGLLLIFAGNLFLLTKGFDNRLNKAVYKADSNWVKVDKEKLNELITLNKKIQKWDISAIDITSNLGVFLFIMVLLVLLFLWGLATESYNITLNILVADIAILFLPHWFSGFKRITTIPTLINKIKLIQKIVASGESFIKNHTIEYNVLAQGDEEKLPKDIKFKVNIADQPKSFLGVYGQLNMNNVQGKLYPYFYTVLVAKKEFKLKNRTQNIQPMSRTVIEYKTTGDLEIMVIRQQTTKTSGYHTNPQMMMGIFRFGVQTAEVIIAKQNL